MRYSFAPEQLEIVPKRTARERGVSHPSGDPLWQRRTSDEEVPSDDERHGREKRPIFGGDGQLDAEEPDYEPAVLGDIGGQRQQ
jgi:hypothetical protein